MSHSPYMNSIKKEEDEDQYVFDYSNTFTRREFDKDVYYYSSLGTAMAEQQAGGPNLEVNGSSSCQFDPPFHENLIPPMMPMRTMKPMAPMPLPLMTTLQPMSPTPFTPLRSPMPVMSPLPSMWSMWSMPTFPPRSQINHPIWLHPFTHQCSDDSLREELCWDSWCTREGRCWTACCG
ncbi:hypothetical protein K457DRAFT_142865 [Linnemannia elongata AG-77]|uniref:Uncharacterized protein n=1 Tax=Linnemannia elongata AG-77 TaxID=1314771 RepID=A0A197JDV5_9FUNG|nr:hypothetical protein K457DRAFT_142865 [Linnemannia elongata AG-77]